MGIEEVVPTARQQEIIQAAIFDELVPTGSASETTVVELVKIAKTSGADCVALACTELPLVLSAENCGMPVIDTTAVLADAAVRHAMALIAGSSHDGPLDCGCWG